MYGEVAGVQLVHSNILHIYISTMEPKIGIAIMNISVLKLRLHHPPLSSFDEALCRSLTGTARTFFLSIESESEYDRISLPVFTDKAAILVFFNTVNGCYTATHCSSSTRLQYPHYTLGFKNW